MSQAKRLSLFDRYLSLWPESGAALAAVVGVLVEVPVMLSVCAVCNRTKRWFDAGGCR